MAKKPSAGSTIDDIRLDKFETPSKASNNAAGSTLLLIAVLVVLVTGSLFFSVKSLWNVTHPELNFTLPDLRSLKLIADNLEVPDFELPTDALPQIEIGDTIVNQEAVASFFESVNESEDWIIEKLPKEDLAAFGQSICEAKASGSTDEKILSDFRLRLIFEFPALEGLDNFAAELVDRSLQNLCP